MAALPCQCGSTDDAVKDTRQAERFGMHVIRRRRKCNNCGSEVWTVEIKEDVLMTFSHQIETDLIAALIEAAGKRLLSR